MWCSQARQLHRRSYGPLRLYIAFLHGIPKRKIAECYLLLGASDDFSTTELKEAYLKLAKQYHPDRGSKYADSYKFCQIQEAYDTLLKHREIEVDKSEEVTFDIKHTAPQHRQYLSYEGVGFGTPGKRQRQYQQYKVMRAADTVYEYKAHKVYAPFETSVVSKDKRETRRRTIRSAMDRLVEDLIAESMARGDFDNLPGQGKPLDYSNHNPHIDTATHNRNKILINSGYKPEWVTLEKEIRTGISDARDKLLRCRIQCGPEPLPARSKRQWDEKLSEFHNNLAQVNLKINKLNMVVPSLRQQMVPYRASREIKWVLNTYKEKLDSGELTDEKMRHVEYQPIEQDNISLKDVWKELKALFSAS